MPENEDFTIELAAMALLTAILNKKASCLQKAKNKTDLVFTTFIHNYKIKILQMNLEKQKFADTILTIVDHATGTPIDATFENVVLESSDPAVFTCTTDVNNDGKVDLVGVSEGTASLNVTADATYVDGNTGETVTKTKTASVPVTITAPPPEAQSTDLIVTFTAAEAVPAAPAQAEAPGTDPGA